MSFKVGDRVIIFESFDKGDRGIIQSLNLEDARVLWTESKSHWVGKITTPKLYTLVIDNEWLIKSYLGVEEC